MQVNENRLTARLGVAWPGIVAVAIVGFWLGLWANLVPSPASLGSAAGYASLLKPKEIAFVPSVVKLRQLFARIEYDLDTVRSGERMVPPLYLASVPRGMRKIQQPAERKQVFLRMMLPLVLKANEGVRAERNRLLRIKHAQETGTAISDDDRVYLKNMARRYGVRKPSIDLLLARVDILPVSIALAQSAIESGWGTSRFVLEGNAPFGQWTTASFKGLVPKDRTDGKTHKIRAFDDLYESVRSYIHNLNTHRAYRRFRAMRETMRASGARLDSLTLISSLKSYSEKGDAYVKLLKNVIVVNQLEPLDRARLGERMPRGESGV
jgi:Bax protein